MPPSRASSPPTTRAPYSFASTNATNGLIGNSTFRANAVSAGLPANFFIANPDLIGGANVTGNGGYTRYDSLQIEGRKRLSHGFQVRRQLRVRQGVLVEPLLASACRATARCRRAASAA